MGTPTGRDRSRSPAAFGSRLRPEEHSWSADWLKSALSDAWVLTNLLKQSEESLPKLHHKLDKAKTLVIDLKSEICAEDRKAEGLRSDIQALLQDIAVTVQSSPPASRTLS